MPKRCVVVLCLSILILWIPVVTGLALAGDSATDPPAEPETATFAGGCFWCMEPPFDKLPGVLSTTVGYAGGHVKNPAYKQVSRGKTGHAEVIQIRYDPSKITYQELLLVFWHNIDPTVSNRQFCDRGSQYRTAIFYHDSDQKKLAEESHAFIARTKPFSKPLVTEITALDTFYVGEEYHQDFYKKNPAHYKNYRHNCGRDKRLKELWGVASGH